MNDITYTNADPAVLMAMLTGIGIVALVGYVIQSIFLGMIFKKAGVEMWKAWVPLYNFWVFLELGGQKGWISLLLLLAWVPVLGAIAALVVFVFSCIAAYKIGENLGKEGVFVLLYIFVTIVWLIWLAVDKSTWKGAAMATAPVQVVPAGPAEASATPPSSPTMPESAPSDGSNSANPNSQ